MGKSKHTPGPWRIADEDELDNIDPKDGDFGIWHDFDEYDFAQSIRIAGVDTEYCNPEHIKGNAQLIAAAPEMLLALKACAVTLSEVFEANGLDPDKNQAIRLAVEAVKKAEGS